MQFGGKVSVCLYVHYFFLHQMIRPSIIKSDSECWFNLFLHSFWRRRKKGDRIDYRGGGVDANQVPLFVLWYFVSGTRETDMIVSTWYWIKHHFRAKSRSLMGISYSLYILFCMPWLFSQNNVMQLQNSLSMSDDHCFNAKKKLKLRSSTPSPITCKLWGECSRGSKFKLIIGIYVV